MSPEEVIARVYRNSDTPAIYRAMIRAATSPGAPERLLRLATTDLLSTSACLPFSCLPQRQPRSLSMSPYLQLLEMSRIPGSDVWLFVLSSGHWKCEVKVNSPSLTVEISHSSEDPDEAISSVYEKWQAITAHGIPELQAPRLEAPRSSSSL